MPEGISSIYLFFKTVDYYQVTIDVPIPKYAVSCKNGNHVMKFQDDYYVMVKPKNPAEAWYAKLVAQIAELSTNE